MVKRPKARKKIMTKVSTIEGLAGMIADMHGEMTDKFDKIDVRFEKIDARFVRMENTMADFALEMRGGFAETKRQLDRIDTRLAALEVAVFGASTSGGGKLSQNSILGRLAKLEKAVFIK